MSVWEELGPGIFRRRYPLLDQNVGLVCGLDQALLVDTRPTLPATRELLEDVRRITRLPVRHVVNTHFHFDHTFGNALFPEAQIWGHTRCARTLRRAGERHRADAIASTPDLAPELANAPIVAPGRTLDGAADLTIGGRTVTLRHLGRGHTSGDLVVLVPDADVCFAGDLLEEGAPPSFEDSYPLQWPATVERLLSVAAGAAAAGHVVPGHGNVVGRAHIEAQLALLRTVETESRLGRARHEPAHEVAARLTLPPGIGRLAVERAYLELDTSARLKRGTARREEG